MEKEWEKLRDLPNKCTNDVCCVRRVGGQRSDGSEWWTEEDCESVAKKISFREMAAEERQGFIRQLPNTKSCCEIGS